MADANPKSQAQAAAPAAETAAAAAPAPGLLEQIAEQASEIVREGKLGLTEEEQSAGKEWVGAFIDQAMRGEFKRARSTEASIAEAIARLDDKISDQLNEVLHHPKFQKLEGSWRGLNYLATHSETSTKLKIKVMNVSQRELLRDLQDTDFDQSVMFKKVYEEEYGQLGGEPYGLLVGDYEFGRSPEDVSFLQKMSGVASSAHAPFIAATSPQMFGWSQFTELAGPPDLAKMFDNDLYAKWKSFRESQDSRYVGLVMPHILLRDPYGEGSKTIEAFNFNEKVTGRDHSRYLWGNAAYALASRITDAFAKYEWCAAIRGVEGGGLVEDLPAHAFPTDDGDIALKCPTEIAITDRRDYELSNLGFISLCHEKHSDRAVFFGTQSCQKPKQYYDKDANANAALSARLQYILAISRFAHFMKAMMRDKIGSFTSQEKLRIDLNNWIANYVLLDDTADQEAKARFPLREARIDVREVAGKPGAYEAVALLRPHFQLEELTVALSLVARVPPPPK